jgi:DNA polymerase-1
MHKSESEELKSLVKEKMEQAITLDVPLIVDIGEGINWLEAH